MRMKILENIITGDKSWVYGYDVETKEQARSKFKVSSQLFSQF
jgi:hypothetical protein